MIFFNSIAYKFHSPCIFGIGGMIGEHSIGIKELTAIYICTESFQNVCCIEAAYTVACINDYLKAVEGMVIVLFGVYFLFDEFTQISCIGTHVVGIGYFAVFTVFGSLAFLSIFEDSSDVITFKTALTGEEFQTVSVIGMMAGSYLYSTVTFKFNGRHEHCGSGGKVTVDDIYACIEQGLLYNSSNGRS